MRSPRSRTKFLCSTGAAVTFGVIYYFVTNESVSVFNVSRDNDNKHSTALLRQEYQTITGIDNSTRLVCLLIDITYFITIAFLTSAFIIKPSTFIIYY